MKYFYTMCFLISFNFIGISQYHFVNIVLSTSSENAYPDNQPLFLSGNDLLMGNWNLKSALMKQNTDSSRVASLILQKGQEIEFCFTNGMNFISGLDSSLICPLKYKVQSDTSLFYHFPKLDFSNQNFDPINK